MESGKLTVFMVDECHLLWGDICGYGWGKTEQRLETSVKSFREKQSYFGALDYEKREFLLQAFCSADSESTVAFIQYLRAQRPGQRIVIIWDGVSYHRSQVIRDYLQKINAGLEANEWAVTCLLFSPYAPEQNPVEDIWLQGKRFIRWFYHTCRSFNVVKHLFEWILHHQIFDFPKLYEYWLPS